MSQPLFKFLVFKIHLDNIKVIGIVTISPTNGAISEGKLNHLTKIYKTKIAFPYLLLVLMENLKIS